MSASGADGANSSAVASQCILGDSTRANKPMGNTANAAIHGRSHAISSRSWCRREGKAQRVGAWARVSVGTICCASRSRATGEAQARRLHREEWVSDLSCEGLTLLVIATQPGSLRVFINREAAVVGIVVLLYFAVFMVSPYDLGWHFGDGSGSPALAGCGRRCCSR